jgi:hypothetical protein
MLAASGRRETACSTGRRMANPWVMVRNQCQAISIRRIHMMFPGIGHIDIRRRSHHLNDPMCRAAPPRPSRFPDVAARSKP